SPFAADFGRDKRSARQPPSRQDKVPISRTLRAQYRPSKGPSQVPFRCLSRRRRRRCGKNRPCHGVPSNHRRDSLSGRRASALLRFRLRGVSEFSSCAVWRSVSVLCHPRVEGLGRLSSSASAAVVAQGLKWPSCPSARFSRELVPQTIGLLERAKAIEYGKRLLRARRGLHVVTHEPFGAAQCSQHESEFV